MELAGMTLEEKVGQLIQAGFHSLEPDGHILDLIERRRIGGVILFARNVQSTAQVAALTGKLQEAAQRAGTAPLWISIDQEGGMVARITEGVALMPGAMAIAAGGSVEAAYEAALVAGRELRALGVNMNFAPDLDINNNPANPVIGVRSFGESPEAVAEYGAASIRGFQDAGVSATAKHFPGHGDTATDSHLDLPTIPHSRERIEAVELVPFRRAVAAGVDAVMSSHIVFPAFEPERLPATLSRRVLTGLLREELGFDGIILTDCMEMQAIAAHYGTVEAAVMAVEAGADIVLISHSRELQEGALDALLEAVRSGRISEERIDASVRRLLALKRKRLAAGTEPHEAALRLVGCEAHRQTAQRISEASVTLVKDEERLLPLRRVPTLVIHTSAVATSIADEAVDMPHTLGKALAAQGLDVIERIIPVSPDGEALQALLAQAEPFGQVVVGTYNASFYPGQVRLIEALQSLGKRLVVVALRNPYDLREFPAVSAYVAVYESRSLALESAAKGLTGATPMRGRLPVTISEAYPAGGGADGSC
ncbi:beta-N-acetylhexosaminidase [Paenibacillus elgii]|uniref:Beta-N-acetylhexosaminidase n=1 Tax=Paenibacillus elgii TaxID=189691 RepID=A0A2T6G179_9BACL|nr:beta-N-acetylhexosaminidase [Paenibacillus elgii]PUA37914.1 beta-N-acetylhexosaminidase [Paenibacillus elgii]